MSKTQQRDAIKRALQGCLAFFVLLVLATFALFLVYVGLKQMSPGIAQRLKDFSTLPPVLSAAIVAGLISLAVSLTNAFISKRWERKWQIEQEHREVKLPIYEEFMAFWFRVMGGQTQWATPVTEEEVATWLKSFTQKLIVWGSDDVVRKYSDFRRRSIAVAQVSKLSSALGVESGHPQPDAISLEALKSFERLLFAIRTDVGHSNKGLKDYDLLRLFINDIDAAVEKVEQAKRSKASEGVEAPGVLITAADTINEGNG